ncbi:hypothetical protein TrispH2_003679 [Trichoplax sp. H2]|uniref:Uncharacterized protein n=1 Tax=Trichoplax adhaerens TaxID=10228 RepID=B3S408_TRIAD|nr:predicted protein [Trichoplax adhaerens]EDV22375.1 predicted protein [Trichoplax adhaerens]RDD43654.1 hypothetical protein TrispH2_003679 [Trichoplax sp. H2]|eukprot:XP_002114919.1 predicted protein [Trichoplax adhaerens]
MSEEESILNIVGFELIVEGLAGVGCGVASILVPIFSSAFRFQYYQGIWAGGLIILVGIYALILYYKDEFEKLWLFIIFIVLASISAFAVAGACGLSAYTAYLFWPQVLLSRPAPFAINTGIALVFLISCIACIRAAIAASQLRKAYVIQIAQSDKQHKINEKNDLIFLAQWEKEKKQGINNNPQDQPAEIIRVHPAKKGTKPTQVAPAEPRQERIKLQVDIGNVEKDLEGEIEVTPEVVKAD